MGRDQSSGADQGTAPAAGLVRRRRPGPHPVRRGRVALLVGLAALAGVAVTSPAVSQGFPVGSAAALHLAADTLPAGPVASPSPSPSPSGPVVLPPVVPADTPRGNDISWTQCSPALGGYANPMPDPGASFVVIGLSQGQAFTTSPCLGDQVAWVKAHAVRAAAYVFPTYPTNAEYAAYGGSGPYTTGTAQGRLMNVGYREATYWVTATRLAQLSTPMVWVDVEKKQRAPWSVRVDRNLAVIRGLLAGLKQAGLRTGIYTTGSHWAEITGGVRLGQVEWRTVGKQTATQALATCARPGVQGSPVLIAQFWNAAGTVDNDVLCPVTHALVARYFHQY